MKINIYFHDKKIFYFHVNNSESMVLTCLYRYF